MRTGGDFRWNCAPLWLAPLVVLLALTSPGSGDVFTSSDKIQTLANQECVLLDALQAYISHQRRYLEGLSVFLLDRSNVFHLTSAEERRKLAEHPNGAFHLIKHFAVTWGAILQKNPELSSKLKPVLRHLPQTRDYQGALSAIVRLQRVYQLQVSDIYIGNYLGYMGPALGPLDALEVGRQAFEEGFLEESIEWLELVVDELKRQEQQANATNSSRSSLAIALSLVGRAYLLMNRREDAKEKYAESLALDPMVGDVVLLAHEINTSAPFQTHKFGRHEWDSNMSDLCLWDGTHRVGELRPYHVCRYKPSLYAPYVRYQEEILSTSPYASVFYNFVSDSEIEALKNFVEGSMTRAKVIGTPASVIHSSRICDLSWIYDRCMDLAAAVSQRVKDVTWLEVDQQLSDRPFSSEPFQVVNYGLGGHYDAHMDLIDPSLDSKEYEKSGGRIATFLIYLSDVERGGNTVFVKSEVSVAPKKGMALFWYNFNPAMETDKLTLHAGCPVVIGHKWIANKWIRTYGNTFRRPCGPQPYSTQLDIEPLMMSYVRRP